MLLAKHSVHCSSGSNSAFEVVREVCCNQPYCLLLPSHLYLVTFALLDASVTPSCVKVAAPCNLIPLVEEWQLHVLVGVVSVYM